MHAAQIPFDADLKADLHDLEVDINHTTVLQCCKSTHKSKIILCMDNPL